MNEAIFNDWMIKTTDLQNILFLCDGLTMCLPGRIASDYPKGRLESSVVFSGHNSTVTFIKDRAALLIYQSSLIYARATHPKSTLHVVFIYLYVLKGLDTSFYAEIF